MSEQSSQPPAVPKRAWYLKWWVWLVAAIVVIGGVGALINPAGEEAPSGVAQPTLSAPTEQSASDAPAHSAPLDLEAFLTESGVAFDSATLSGRKAVIYVPTATTNEQAQQIAHDAMLYICDHATQAGESSPAANRVEVSDDVSSYSPNYNAADHPSGFVTDEVCQG